jgi:tyrosine-protein kinase
VLRRGAWVVVLLAVVGAAGATYLSARKEKLYRASADVFLSSQNLGYALSNVYPPYVDPVREGQTQADLAQTRAVAANAVGAAGVRGRTATQLLGEASVTNASNADVLTFAITDTNRDYATRLATAYARAYTNYRRALDTKALISARDEVQRRLDELKATGQERSDLYSSLSDKYQQLRTLEVLQGSNVLLVRPARGAAQVQPQPKRNGILGGILGLVLGVGIAFLMDALNTRVRSSKEVEDRLDLPLLGRLPEPPRKLRNRDELQMVVDPRAPEAEAYQILATNLDFVNVDRGAKTILVTSGRNEEGKSTTVANLSVALARAGRRVVLIDLDFRRPSLHRYFDPAGHPGLTQVILKHAELDDALIPVPIVDQEASAAAGNGSVAGLLELLTVGPIPPNPAELIRSHALSELLAEVERRADVVLIDSPPMIGLSDTVSLSAKVDALLLVVRLSELRRPVLEETQRLLENARVVKLGFVVTGASADAPYGYSYGYSYTQQPERSRRKVLR